MNLITAGLTTVILAAGVAGSVQGYRVKAEAAGEAVSASAPTPKPRTIVQWEPCKPPSRLENDTCVTDVVRTVVRPAPAAEPADIPDYSDDDDVPQQVAGVRDDDDRYGVERADGDDDRDEAGDRDSDDDGDDRYGEDRDGGEDGQWLWGNGEDDERDDD
jgi:hypothetical protein